MGCEKSCEFFINLALWWYYLYQEANFKINIAFGINVCCKSIDIKYLIKHSSAYIFYFGKSTKHPKKVN